MGVLRRLNGRGDTETHWEEGDVASLLEARSVLADHNHRGGLAYEVDGEEAVVVRKFNPSAKEIILAPRLMGG